MTTSRSKTETIFLIGAKIHQVNCSGKYQWLYSPNPWPLKDTSETGKSRAPHPAPLNLGLDGPLYVTFPSHLCHLQPLLPSSSTAAAEQPGLSVHNKKLPSAQKHWEAAGLTHQASWDPADSGERLCPSSLRVAGSYLLFWNARGGGEESRAEHSTAEQRRGKEGRGEEKSGGEEQRGGPSEGLGRHGPRQDAGRLRLPGRDRWRADTPDCTWSRNVEDDRRTCGLEPSPVSSGRTMTGMCVQSITTPASPYPLLPLSLSLFLSPCKFQDTKKQKVKCGKIS